MLKIKHLQACLWKESPNAYIPNNDPTMADLSVEDKCELAARLIEQTPPGEIK